MTRLEQLITWMHDARNPEGYMFKYPIHEFIIERNMGEKISKAFRSAIESGNHGKLLRVIQKENYDDDDILEILEDMKIPVLIPYMDISQKSRPLSKTLYEFRISGQDYSSGWLDVNKSSVHIDKYADKEVKGYIHYAYHANWKMV